MLKIKMEGAAGLIKKLEDLQKGLEKVSSETQSIGFDEMFPNSFAKEHTGFKTMADFFEASPINLEDIEGPDEIGGDEFEAFVAEHTDFEDWLSLLKTATGQALRRRISGNDL